MNFAKFLRIPFLIKHLWWLLLNQVTNLSNKKTGTEHMQRGTLLFMAPEQLHRKYVIKQAKQEDLPNHGSF